MLQLMKGGVIQDSIEGVQVEQGLKESKNEFQTLFNLMPDPVVIVDAKGRFLAVNDRVEEITGFEKEELVGKNFLRTKIVTAKSKAILIKNLMRRMMGKSIEPYEIEGLTKDGEKIPFEVNARKITYEGKAADLVIFRDLRERKKAEKALRESEEKLRLTFENAKDAIFWADPKTGLIIKCNKSAETLLEKKRDEIIGQPQTTLHPPQKAEYYSKMFKRHIEQNGAVDDEAEVITRSGKIKPVHIAASVTSVDGKPIIQGIFRDITERKKMEKELKEYTSHLEEMVEERTKKLRESQERLLQSERLAAVGELAAMVGHDLRNPLQSIENVTYYLNNELLRLSPSTSIPQKTMQMLEIINESVNYADKILRDLQDFSAMKKPMLQKTNINAIVSEALSQLKVPQEVKIITKLNRLPETKVDRTMIKRAFLNIATNGIQAMKNGGTLKVSTKKTKDSIVVSFKDTGIGMSKEDMKKIFTPFFTTKAKGIGMGLSICRKFVDAHGGSIQVESEEGKGSTFTVELPIR